MLTKKLTFLNFIILFSLFWLSTSVSQGQFSDNIDITFTPKNDRIRLGDQIILNLSVSYPLDYERLTISPLPQTWGDFEVISQSDIIHFLEGKRTSIQQIVVTIFEPPGTYQTPTWSITLVKPDGEKIERAVPQATLTVISILSPGDTDLRDIKPQADLPIPPLWPRILGVLILLGVLARLGWVLYQRFKSNNRPLPEPILRPVVDTRSAHVIAYEELARIEALDLPGQGRLKEYYSLISECLRHYLEKRYNLPAMDLTTSEIESQFNQLNHHNYMSPNNSQLFVGLFKNCDLVKFARFIPNIDEAETLISRARNLVDLTKMSRPSDLSDPPISPDPDPPVDFVTEVEA